MANYKHVKIYKGEFSGIGKSEKIKQEIQQNGRLEYHRIPIYGELNRDKLIDLHTNKIYGAYADKVKYSKEVKDPIGIHYDVYPTANGEPNDIMFQLIFLGSLQDHNCKTFYLPEGTKIFVELSHSLKENITKQVFFLFEPITPMKWDFTNIKIEFSSDDKYQRVCKYFLALQNKDTYDIRKLVKESKPMPTQQCQAIINNHITSTLKNPNFYYINSFVTFVNEQLTLLEKST
jgi:hypothetical protein